MYAPCRGGRTDARSQRRPRVTCRREWTSAESQSTPPACRRQNGTTTALSRGRGAGVDPGRASLSPADPLSATSGPLHCPLEPLTSGTRSQPTDRTDRVLFLERDRAEVVEVAAEHGGVAGHRAGLDRGMALVVDAAAEAEVGGVAGDARSVADRHVAIPRAIDGAALEVRAVLRQRRGADRQRGAFAVVDGAAAGLAIED